VTITFWGNEMRFQALQDFWSDETQSNYCRGLYYMARLSDTKLAALLPLWEHEGKIALGGPAARLQGEG
jgi:hypothetical protein